jgi:hypothetical protein
MSGPSIRTIAFALALSLLAPAATAQGRYDPATLEAAQREAMRSLSFMDGAWRGTAWVLDSNGGRQGLVQTERVGPLLDGAVRLVEGRGYDAAGRTRFNALGIISFNPATRSFTIRAYTMGMGGEFPFRPLPNGFVWETPAGPGATIRYTASFAGGEWHEIGERIAGDAAPVKVIEMRLRRIGNSGWPAAGPVPRR